ncbi:MAG: amidohydrolase family protein [Pedobacter sp.]|nr:amidohydrolase family protein [Pedobacter sp.]
MRIIDSHQHFWQFDPIRDEWINDDMRILKRDFLPKDLKPLLTDNGVEGCVVIQSDQSEVENFFQLENAQTFEFIRGVVGWVNLEANTVEERLDHYAQFKKMKGFRHILQGELARDRMLHPAFMKGIGLLGKHNYTYDILVFPDQLQYLPELLAAFPNQRFVIDHLAFIPMFKAEKFDPDAWASIYARFIIFNS